MPSRERITNRPRSGGTGLSPTFTGKFKVIPITPARKEELIAGVKLLEKAILPFGSKSVKNPLSSPESFAMKYLMGLRDQVKYGMSLGSIAEPYLAEVKEFMKGWKS